MKYIYLICPVTALIICQLIKFTIESIKNKKLDFARLLNGSGGMPSTHTTFSFSLAMTIGYMLGFETPLFAIALVFALITSYDALGVRYESGKQAIAINYLLKKDGKIDFQKLKEKIGHEPLEVFVGMLLGAFVSFLFCYFV